VKNAAGMELTETLQGRCSNAPDINLGQAVLVTILSKMQTEIPAITVFGDDVKFTLRPLC
jgi:hypothetical protein